MRTAPAAPHVRTLIVGAGFAGVAMAIRLRAAGDEDWRLIERASAMGGTWRDNAYPGAACDVQSVLYSYSFAPQPRWSRRYAPQQEIDGYLVSVARRYAILNRVGIDEQVRLFDHGGPHPLEPITAVVAKALVWKLGIMLAAVVVFMPLIVFYTRWAYGVMAGKVTLAYIREHERSAY